MQPKLRAESLNRARNYKLFLLKLLIIMFRTFLRLSPNFLRGFSAARPLALTLALLFYRMPKILFEETPPGPEIMD